MGRPHGQSLRGKQAKDSEKIVSYDAVETPAEGPRRNSGTLRTYNAAARLVTSHPALFKLRARATRRPDRNCIGATFLGSGVRDRGEDNQA